MERLNIPFLGKPVTRLASDEMSNLIPINPNVLWFDGSPEPLKTLENIRWNHIARGRKKPRFLIVGQRHLAVLVDDLAKHGITVKVDTVSEILGMTVVRVNRDGLELGE